MWLQYSFSFINLFITFRIFFFYKSENTIRELRWRWLCKSIALVFNRQIRNIKLLNWFACYWIHSLVLVCPGHEEFHIFIVFSRFGWNWKFICILVVKNQSIWEGKQWMERSSPFFFSLLAAAGSLISPVGTSGNSCVLVPTPNRSLSNSSCSSSSSSLSNSSSSMSWPENKFD